MKHLRSLIPVLALVLLGAGCLSKPTTVVPPTPISASEPSVVAAPALPEGTFKTKNGKLDNVRNVKLVTATDGVVSSPLIITGEARLWYFEASFPVKLLDRSGKALVETFASADGDWMTEEWVPFTAELIFPTQLSGSRGQLILMDDNPSGLPENADQVEIPVTF